MRQGVHLWLLYLEGTIVSLAQKKHIKIQASKLYYHNNLKSTALTDLFLRDIICACWHFIFKNKLLFNLTVN